MIAVGVTLSPIEFFNYAKTIRAKFSVNDASQANSLFLGLEKFIKHRPSINKQKCLIFDSLERLQSVNGLPIVVDKNPAKVLEKVKNMKPVSVTGISRNYVTDIIECLEKNKDKDQGFLHIFSTNLYKITQKPTREAVRHYFLSLLTNSIKREYFKKEMKKITPKKGKALIAFECLMDLTETDAFKSMQDCMQKAKVAKNDREIEALAVKYDVSAFDIRYFLSTLK